MGGGTVLPAQSACLEMLGVKGPHPTLPGENASQVGTHTLDTKVWVLLVNFFKVLLGNFFWVLLVILVIKVPLRHFFKAPISTWYKAPNT